MSIPNDKADLIQQDDSIDQTIEDWTIKQKISKSCNLNLNKSDNLFFCFFYPLSLKFNSLINQKRQIILIR